MNEIYPIAKLGNHILIVNRADLPYIGKDRALEVKCVRIDLEHRIIDPVSELETHLKFNPWEEIAGEEERNLILEILNTKFSDLEIVEKIMEPSAEHSVKRQ